MSKASKLQSDRAILLKAGSKRAKTNNGVLKEVNENVFALEKKENQAQRFKTKFGKWRNLTMSIIKNEYYNTKTNKFKPILLHSGDGSGFPSNENMENQMEKIGVPNDFIWVPNGEIIKKKSYIYALGCIYEYKKKSGEVEIVKTEMDSLQIMNGGYLSWGSFSGAWIKAKNTEYDETEFILKNEVMRGLNKEKIQKIKDWLNGTS